MQYKQYREETKLDLPPNLEAGTLLVKVERIERNNFKLNGQDTKGMRVFADGKEWRTSSGVLMEQFENFFKEHPNEILENVKVIQPRGKKYLTLEAI